MIDSLRNSIANADEILINVSFVRDSGTKLLVPDLIKAKEQNKVIKILTSDYMGVTEPNALYRLIGIGDIRLFNNIEKKSFHPKTYIFKNKNKIECYVGSSNISYSALVSGVEWNYHFTGDSSCKEINNILFEFDELYEKNSFHLTLEWLREYEKTYKKNDFDKIIDPEIIKTEKSMEIAKIEPIKFQIPALYELSKTREEGYKKAMVVVGTGLGKTYLSAFDTLNFNRILFVAHRDEILRDAKKTFENLYKNSKSYGFFNGYMKETGKDITFASITTLSKDEYLSKEYFSQEYFDYIVVDEFHHSSSPSYLKILDYFKPSFLLGLTATPERLDSGDVYKICDYNIAYECDFKNGINNGWLTPFEYFGIYDETDYSVIPWRSGKYDLKSLENSLTVEKRIELVYKKYLECRGKSTIGFCATIKHCEAMNTYFQKKGIKSEIIIGETPINKRQDIINSFKSGKLDIIFTVDVFNEGVDIPCIDTVLFLRPTNSYTIFIQQLGRGLRTFEGKKKLRVLDFVGNYKGAELRPLFLMGKYKIKDRKEGKMTSPIDADFNLPSGCSANFDFKLIDYFEKIKNQKDNLQEKIKLDFLQVKELLQKRPNMMDIYTYGEIPVHTYLQKYKTWKKFLESVNELNEEEKNFTERSVNFLQFLEKTAMTKSYKIPLLLSLFDEKVVEKRALNEIGEAYEKFYSDELHGKDLNNKKHTEWKNWSSKNFEDLARENPIYFLTNENKNIDFFDYSDGFFNLNYELYKEIKNNKSLFENILDRLEYRKVNYFRRKYMEE